MSVDGRVAPAVRVAVLLALALCQGEVAWAGEFTLNRVKLFLSATTKSDLLTVTNRSDETLRFQLSVAAWDQTPEGAIVLTPTKDIVFFPPLFSLAPGGERNVRVGTTAPPGAAEKSYRLFIEELPPTATSAPESGQVRVLVKMGLPIFLQPPKRLPGGRIDGLALRRGHLSLRIVNTGNVHMVVQQVRIKGVGDAGETVVEGALAGWYVLAGGTRAYEFPLPADRCADVKTLSVHVQTPESTLAGRLDVSAGACEQ